MGQASNTACAAFVLVCVCDGCSAAAAAITGVLGEMRQLVQGGVCVNGARGPFVGRKGLVLHAGQSALLML